MRRAGAGYTLVELLVVMAVLGILAWVAMPLAEIALQRDRERELKRALWELRSAIDAYKQAADAGQVATGPNGYPPTLDALVQGVSDGRGGRRYFLRRLPVDPFMPAGSGWGLRSYESPPDNPQPGADVYDVRSLSAKTSLGGTPLREW
jgi:general secretion pathway protein G